MTERSTALTFLTFDGSPAACQHAVLITSEGPGATGSWSVVLLGLSRRDLQKLAARAVPLKRSPRLPTASKRGKLRARRPVFTYGSKAKGPCANWPHYA